MSVAVASPAITSDVSKAGTIHVVHVVLSLDHGGLERTVLNLVEQAARQLHKPRVICLERRGDLAERVEAMGAEVHCIHKQPGLRLNTIRIIEEVLAKWRPDVVHTHQIGALFYTGPAARRLNVPVIVHTEHGKRICGIKQSLLAWWAARYAQRFFCVSSDILHTLRGSIVPGSKMELIANGIDTARLAEAADTSALRKHWSIPEDAIVLGTVGRLAQVKRHDLMLRTFSLVHQRKPSTILVLIGDGPERNALERLADDLGIRQQVRFIGFQADPGAYFHLLSMFLLTSQSEGMPLSLLEAWAAGVPTAAFAVGGLPELIQSGQTGWLAPFNDVEQLAGHVLQCMDHPEMAQQFVQNSREKVRKQFDVSIMAAAYDRRYRELLARSRA